MLWSEYWAEAKYMNESHLLSTPLVFHPIYSQLDLPFKHRFPIEKYQAIYDLSLIHI